LRKRIAGRFEIDKNWLRPQKTSKNAQKWPKNAQKRQKTLKNGHFLLENAFFIIFCSRIASAPGTKLF